MAMIRMLPEKRLAGGRGAGRGWFGAGRGLVWHRRLGNPGRCVAGNVFGARKDVGARIVAVAAAKEGE